MYRLHVGELVQTVARAPVREAARGVQVRAAGLFVTFVGEGGAQLLTTTTRPRILPTIETQFRYIERWVVGAWYRNLRVAVRR
jgi:hypothetical protein